MKLKKYTDELGVNGRDSFANQLDISGVYLWQIIHNKRNPSAKVARKIHIATDRTVSLEELRPDIWGEVV